MIPILITATLSLMLGTIVGMFLTVLCQIQNHDYREYDLIPITTAEPMVGTNCIIQIQEDDHLFIGEYREDGWVLSDYPHIKEFTVTGWCYTPAPIKAGD